MTEHSQGFTTAKRGRWGRERERISRCKSSLQMSKYAVNHSEDLRVLRCFLTESVSQPSGSRMTKTLIGVFRGSGSSPPIPPLVPAQSQDCANIRPNQNGLHSDVVQMHVLFETKGMLAERIVLRTNYLFSCVSPFP